MFRILCDPSSGSTELCLTEITRSDSQIFCPVLVGVWQRNFEPVVCVCTVRPAVSNAVCFLVNQSLLFRHDCQPPNILRKAINVRAYEFRDIMLI